MRFRPDVVIADRFGTTAAIVEVKALNGASVQTATRYLRNLLVHGAVPHARFVMLITPECGYLWSEPEKVLLETAPTLSFPMDRIVEHYLPADGAHVPVRDLVLEPIVRQWLADLSEGIVVDPRVENSLDEIGFLEVVRGGRVYTQTPA